jgi:hypothetical protein
MVRILYGYAYLIIKYCILVNKIKKYTKKLIFILDNEKEEGYYMDIE